MKAVFAIAAIAALLGPPALAADMAVKAPQTVPPAVVPDAWTGFYLGGSVGGRWASVGWTTLDFMGNGTPNSFNNPADLNQSTVRLGGYLGYNWHLAPAWVVGLDGDIAWGHSNATSSPFPGDPFAPAGAIGHDFVTTKLGWDGSVRGRLGYLVTPTWLLYATAGAAWQQITTSASCDGAGPSSYCGSPGFSDSSSTTKAGWTVGGGAEVALWSNLFLRAEYRYADFGHVANTLPPAPTAGFNASVRVKTNTGLLGLAYKF